MGQVIERKTVNTMTGAALGETITYTNGVPRISLWSGEVQGAALKESLHVSFFNADKPTFSTSPYLAPVLVTSPSITIDYAKKSRRPVPMTQ